MCDFVDQDVGAGNEESLTISIVTEGIEQEHGGAIREFRLIEELFDMLTIS